MRRVKAAALTSQLVKRHASLKEAIVKPGDITAEPALREEHPRALHARIAEEFRAAPEDLPASLAKLRARLLAPPDERS